MAHPDLGHLSGWRQKSWPIARQDRMAGKSVQVQISSLSSRFPGQRTLETGGNLPRVLVITFIKWA